MVALVPKLFLPQDINITGSPELPSKPMASRAISYTYDSIQDVLSSMHSDLDKLTLDKKVGFVPPPRQASNLLSKSNHGFYNDDAFIELKTFPQL